MAHKNYLMKAPFKQWLFSISVYNQYGLKYNDIYDETPDVKEALRRLPQHIVDERTFRIVRAMQLNANKSILPKEQWTKFEDDDRYLDPYLEEVRKENKEKADWNKD